MIVESSHLGTLEVDPEAVIEVVGGLVGLPDAHRFVSCPAEATCTYSWWQSVDDSELAFLLVVPAPFFPEYEPDIPGSDCELIGLENASDAQVLCLVTVSDQDVTANLLGPVVLNVRTRQARQVVLDDPVWGTRAPIVPTA